MWIRFWSGHKDNPPIDKDFDEFVWFDKEQSDEVLKDEARELMPQWVWDTDRNSYYGFERLEKLPDDVRMMLIKAYEGNVRHAQSMLDLLRDDDD